MFASLKNKIKEETGADLTTTNATGRTLPTYHNNNNNNSISNNRMRSRFSSTLSVNSNNDDIMANQEHHNNSVSGLRSQCNELTTKISDLSARLGALQEEKTRVEKTNEILLESVKVAQTQKDLYCEEQEKIQNIQQSEIEKLKSLLSFREQEAVDRLATTRQNQQQIETFSAELERLKKYEHLVDDLQDELEQLRHSSQQGKNNLTTTLAAVEEENRHLKMRLNIVEQVRLEAFPTLADDEKLQALIQERRLLEQHLEEAHLQLSDIKSSWSGQNLALETQVSRLSKQVAEETTEKRKALKARDDLVEKVKQLQFEMLKFKDEIKERDDKIKLLEEELDELNLALKECRDDNEQKIVFERNRVDSLESQKNDLKTRLNASDERFSEYATNAELIAQNLRQQTADLQDQNADIQKQLDQEREEKLTALLRNAEISQSEELLKKELRIERDDAQELHERNAELEAEVKAKQAEVSSCQQEVVELKAVVTRNETQLKEVDELQREMSEKNKTIKVLNQRLSDLKRTIQKEFKNTKSFDACISALEKTNTAASTAANGHVAQNLQSIMSNTKTKSLCNNCGTNLTSPGCIVMDEVNFKYLKHVIVKFLTSREVEARHLIRAVATLLKLNKDEEKLLHDTLNWKMSWFGSRPDHGSGQHAFSIPPS